MTPAAASTVRRTSDASLATISGASTMSALATRRSPNASNCRLSLGWLTTPLALWWRSHIVLEPPPSRFIASVLPELASLMRALGCTDAMNLDGGDQQPD